MKPGSVLAGAVVALALALVLAGVLFIWGGLTHRTTWPLEQSLGNAAVALSAKWHARGLRNPTTESTSTLTLGQTAYRTCVQCHGATGDGAADLGRLLYPPAANLLAAPATSMTDAELFWVIKNGLSFTAMPAYKTQYRDDAIWALVGYIRALQQGRALAFGPPLASASAADRALIQNGRRVSLQMTDSAMQPPTADIGPGVIEFDIANRGTRGHQVVISRTGKIAFNAGRVLPTETMQLQGTVESGDYTIAVDPTAASPGPTATLTVR